MASSTPNTNTSLSLNPRPRNSVLGGTAPLTNSAHPYAGIFVPPRRLLPTSIMTTMTGGRRQGIRRHTSNPGISDNNSVNGLLERNDSGGGGTASGGTTPVAVAGTSSSNSGNNTGADIATNSPRGGWSNLGSMVQNISNLMPTTAAIHQVARQVISSSGVSRSVGNRRPTTAPPRSNSTSAEPSTANVDDLLGLLAAMEDAEETSGSQGRSRNRQGSISTPAVSCTNLSTTNAEPTPSTSGTSRPDILNRLSEDSEQNDTPDQVSLETRQKKTNDQEDTPAIDANPILPIRIDMDGNADSDGNQDEPAEEPQANDNANQDSEEESPDDPYWSGVLWQLPIFCLVLVCKYLQYYFVALCVVIILAAVFHYYNMVVKYNVVSHKTITIGYSQCVSLLFTKLKKSLTQFCFRGRAPPLPTTFLQATANRAGSENSPAREETAISNNPEVPAVITQPSIGTTENVVSDSDTGEASGLTKTETESSEPKVVLFVGEDCSKSKKVHFTNASEEEGDNASGMVQVNPTYSESDTAPTTSQEGSSVKVPDCITIDMESDSPPQTFEVDLSDIVPRQDDPRSEPNPPNAIQSPVAEVNAPTNPRTVQVNSALLESLNISEEEQQAQESVLCVIERLRLLVLTVFVIPMAVYLFYGILWRDHAVYRCLLFLPPVIPPYKLSSVLWLTLVLDYLARIITAWVKGWMVIIIWMQRNSSLIHKGRYFPMMEMTSQLYRSFLPIIPWFFYIYASYAYYAKEELKKLTDDELHSRVDPEISNTLKSLQGLYDHYWSQVNSSDFNSTEGDMLMAPGLRSTVDPGMYLNGVTTTEGPHVNRVLFSTTGITGNQLFGMALFIMYLLHKKVDAVSRISNLWQALKALKTNSGSYGTKPSKCELEKSGGKCPICHDQYRVPILLKCSHIFCESCIVQWFQRERICPMCRAQIADDPMWKDGSTSQMFQVI